MKQDLVAVFVSYGKVAANAQSLAFAEALPSYMCEYGV